MKTRADDSSSDKYKNLDADTQNKLLNLIDFNKLSQKTLEDCQKCEHIPPKYVAEAALTLCAKLRKELDEQKAAAAASKPSYNDYNAPPRQHYIPSPTNQRINPDLSPSSGYTPRYCEFISSYDKSLKHKLVKIPTTTKIS